MAQSAKNRWGNGANGRCRERGAETPQESPQRLKLAQATIAGRLKLRRTPPRIASAITLRFTPCAHTLHQRPGIALTIRMWLGAGWFAENRLF